MPTTPHGKTRIEINGRYVGDGEVEINFDQRAEQPGPSGFAAAAESYLRETMEQVCRATQDNLARLLFNQARPLREALDAAETLRLRLWGVGAWNPHAPQEYRARVRETLSLWRQLARLVKRHEVDSVAWHAAETCGGWPFTDQLVPTFIVLTRYLRDHDQMHGTTENALRSFDTDPVGHATLAAALEKMSPGEKQLAYELVALAAMVTYPPKRSDAPSAAAG